MRILRMQKEIGVTLTDSLLMTPAKSVTALIGMSGTDRDSPVSGCDACARGKDCAYKREGA
jgi:5-methyltetrahydrofolate--homocysteine methyltransferase